MENKRNTSPNCLINNLNASKKRKNFNYSSTHSKINKIKHPNVNINTDIFNDLNINNNNISNKQLTQEQIIIFQKKQIEDLQNKVNDLEKNSHKYQLKLLKAEKDFQNQKTINEIQNYKNTSTNFYMKTDIIKFWENLNQNFLDIFLDFENSPIIMFKLINLVFYICNQLINNFFFEKYNKTLEIINIPKNSNTIYEVEKNLMPFIKEHLNNIFSETIVNNFYIEFKSLFKKMYLTMKIDKEENFNLMFESEKSFKSLIDNAKKLILVGLFNIEPLKFEIDINNLIPKIITINNREEKNKFIVLNDNKKTQFKAVVLLNPPLFKNGHTLFKEMKPYIIEYDNNFNYDDECENSIENNNIFDNNSFNFNDLTFKRKIPSDIYSDNNILNDINNNNNENENILNNNNMLNFNKHNNIEINNNSNKKSSNKKIIINNNNNLNDIHNNKIINTKKQKFFHKKNNSITSKKKSLQISINNNNNFLDENKNSNKSSFICTTSILSSRTDKRINAANYSKEFREDKVGNYFVTDNIDFDNITNNNTFNNFFNVNNNNNSNNNNINNNCNIRTVNTNKYKKNKNTKNKNNNFVDKNKNKIKSGEKINYSKNFSNIQLQNNFFKNINISNFFKYNNNKRNHSHTTITKNNNNNNKNYNNNIINNNNNNIIINNFNNKLKKPSSNRNFPKELIDFHEILSERFIKFKSHKNNNNKKNNNNLNKKIININNNNNYKIQNININLININNKYNSNNNNNNNIDIKKKKNFKNKDNKNNNNINNKQKNQESFFCLNDIDDINNIIYNKTKNNNKEKNDIIYTQIYNNNNINYFNKKNISQIKLVKNEKK